MANELLYFNGINGATSKCPVETLNPGNVSRLVPEESLRRRSHCAGSHRSGHSVTS